MKAINATPKNIRQIFSDTYVIPDFQRPYSWNIEECETLWNDIIEFHEDIQNENEKYFLGNIVIHLENDNYSVIDGQQRLTTLQILIKAFFTKAGVVAALEKCLKKEDKLTAQVINELRVESKVLANDKINLYDIIFNEGTNTTSSNFLDNFIFFKNKIDLWFTNTGSSSDKLNKLILTILDRLVILPILCDSEDDALVIFETINNRGLPLTDADIFKAKIHRASGEEKDYFLDTWKKLENHEWLFRIFMHVDRGNNDDVSKEKALRKYFSSSLLLNSDWRKTLDSIELFYEIENTNWLLDPVCNSFWGILSTYPNYYWNYPKIGRAHV